MKIKVYEYDLETGEETNREPALTLTDVLHVKVPPGKVVVFAPDDGLRVSARGEDIRRWVQPMTEFVEGKTTGRTVFRCREYNNGKKGVEKEIESVDEANDFLLFRGAYAP